MKSVLISIQPKWCELIASGEKTIEVRKTKPNIKVPFKVYIYETKALYKPNGCKHFYEGRGQVIGEFVCDDISEFESELWDDETYERITRVVHTEDWEGYPETESYYVAEDGEDNYLCRQSCLTWEDLRDYVGQDINTFFGWHISDLVIYDKLKELSEFFVWKKCNSCRTSGYESTACIYDEDCKVPAVITRPPQSWCYVDRKEDEGNENH